ncbi:MAG: hypothetical protein SFY95_06185, partial [Planctomycetota bacterium]|nr:hypothetical protein [Planctomycetota bacterium]
GDIDNTGRNAWPFYRAIIDASSLNQAVDPTTNARRTPGGKVQPRLLLENTTQNLFNGSADLEVADVDRVPGFSTKLDLDEVRGRDRSSGESNNWALASSARDSIDVTNADRSRRGLSARAINVFGIEAQPVITEVTTFVVYADWTAFAGTPGDLEAVDSPVTINGSLDPSNPDMLAKALVVQIANPFDYPIRLDLFQFQMGTPTRVTSGGVTRAEYFGPRFAFPADQELAPGESKNYLYIVQGVNGPTADVENYLRSTDRIGTVAGTLVPTWTVGDRFMPDNITTFTTSDQGGTIQWPSGDARFGAQVAPPTTALLWKLVKQDDPTTPVRDEFWMLADRLRDPMTARRDPSGASELNAGRATWGRRLPSTQNAVNGTLAGPDPLDPNFLSTDDPKDNTGYTMLLWGSVRRPPQEVFKDGNNNDAVWASASDGVPAWALETRTVPEPAGTLNLDQPRQISRNIAYCDGQAVDDLASLTKAMFTPSAPYNNAATGTASQFGWRQLFATPAPLVGGMIFDSRYPGETGNGLIQPGFELPIRQSALNKGQPSDSTYTQLSAIRRMPPTRLLLPLFNNRAFSVGPTSSRLRVTDMLLPLAVSPYQDAEARIIASGAGTFDVVEEAVDREWTTTTEAFAMSLPYDRRRDPRYSSVGSSDVYNPSDPQVGTSPTTPGREEKLDDYHPQADRGFPGDIMEDVGSALDRGRLKLDAFVPFIDRGNGSSQGADGVFNVAIVAAAANVSDEVRGLGIPMALTVFEQFRTLRREGLGDAGANAPPAPYRFARPRRAQGLALLPAGLDGPAGSLTRAVPGLVNLNTASLPVLRALPLLSPSDWASGAEGLIEWPLRGTSEYPTQFGQFPDVAATLMAYRDLAPARLRSNAAPSIWTGGDSPRFADFKPTGDWSNNTNRGTRVLLSATDARERTAGVAGLIDQPGLRSIGEAGLARMVRDTGTASGRNYAFERNANNIDHLGQLAEPRDANEFNNADQGQQRDAFGFPRENSVARFDRDPGSSSALFRTNSTTASTMPRRAATLTRGSYLDKLETLAALSNVTSVRSDVFAAWFVVQGYQRGDVERIRSPLDPLVPSFQKRYLMIFDRSNVTQAGQRPRVILFREVPM